MAFDKFDDDGVCEYLWWKKPQPTMDWMYMNSCPRFVLTTVTLYYPNSQGFSSSQLKKPLACPDTGGDMESNVFMPPRRERA